jgi:hypothetical protein
VLGKGFFWIGKVFKFSHQHAKLKVKSREDFYFKIFHYGKATKDAVSDFNLYKFNYLMVQLIATHEHFCDFFGNFIFKEAKINKILADFLDLVKT